VSEHPSPEELHGLWRGGISADQARLVVRHLIRGCARCRAELTPYLGALFGPEAERKSSAAEVEDAYDAALDRAFATVHRSGERRARWSGRAVGEVLTVLASSEVTRPAPAERRPSGLAGLDALLEQARTLRYEDPARMVELARLAAMAADQLDPDRHGARQVADFQCRAWTELANACRVADRLDEAEEALERASGLFLAGTRDDVLGARLLEVLASLHADRRRFEDAFQVLDVAHAVHRRRGDQHLAGRALLKKGLYANYSGEPERAVQILQEGLSLVDPEREPDLASGAMHNLAVSLMESGRLGEARSLLGSGSRPSREAGGRVNRLKGQWVEAHLEAEMGNLDRAASSLEEIRYGFEEHELPYSAALVTLELAAVRLRQGREDAARILVLEAAEVFSTLRIRREGLAAVVLLRRAFEQRVATVSLLDGVIELMRGMM
jgi:tetratricopeptide (TPR) repeat protein